LSIRDYLDLDDNQFELKLTPNRADCLSLTGVAREVAAIAGAQAKFVDVPEVAASITDQRAVVLDAPQACPLYFGRVLKGVNAKAPTPEWMKRHQLRDARTRPATARLRQHQARRRRACPHGEARRKAATPERANHQY
jgi:phenylalanyl-tRNA synthetase beta subunit